MRGLLLIGRTLTFHCGTSRIPIYFHELAHELSVFLVESTASLASSELRAQEILFLVYDSRWLSIFVVRAVAGVGVVSVLAKPHLIICVLESELHFFVVTLTCLLAVAVFKFRPLRERIRHRLWQVSQQI